MGTLKISGRGVALAALIGAIAAPASAATLTTELSFSGYEGAIPSGGNLLFVNKAIYGAAYAGGANDLGAIYQFPTVPNGQAAPLYSFTGLDGIHPNGSLAADASGNLYGTTPAGGASNLGTVFKLTKPATAGGAWTFTLLHDFAGGADGAIPQTGPTLGSDGTLYGTASRGGSGTALVCKTAIPTVITPDPNASSPTGCGTVFKVSPSGAFSIVHEFSGTYADGWYPSTNLVMDPAGDLIGATGAGLNESNAGYLFKVTPAKTYSVVTTFVVGGPVRPTGTIARDAVGNIYGMSLSFGPRFGPLGPGIFEVTAVTHKLMLLASLSQQLSTSGVTLDHAGNLYFTTNGAVTSVGAAGVPTGGGALFTMSHAAGTPIQLAAFTPANQSPTGSVIQDDSGNLWGQTGAGGKTCLTAFNPTAVGCGTLYAVSP